MKKMENNELKSFFRKFSLDSLESIDLLLEKSDDLEKAIYTSIYNEKFELVRDEYEGINEYDYLSRLSNFEINEIIDNIDIFSDKELNYLNRLLNSVLDKTSISSKVILYNGLINERLSFGLSTTELNDLFNKFTICELDELKTIFSYGHEYDLNNIYNIIDKVHSEKENYCYKVFMVPVKSNNYSILNISNRINDFTDKEIILLYKLIEDASFFLSSIQEYDGVVKDFDIDEYPVEIIGMLETILGNELEKRKCKNKELIKALAD